MRLRFLIAALALGGCAAHAQHAAPLLSAPDEPQWTSLFNGANLEGWSAHFLSPPPDGQSPDSLFAVEDGVIHVYPGAPDGSAQLMGYILSDQEFADVRVSVEYRWGQAKFQPRTDAPRDAGLLYYVYEERPDLWPASVESQIQEGDTGDIWAISSQVVSAINSQTDRYAPLDQGGQPVTAGAFGEYHRIKHGAMSEIDGWNRVEVVLRADSATHIVNGVVNNRAADIRQWDKQAGAWARLDHGRIALQAEAAEIYYRNIRVRPLTAEERQ